MHPEIESTARPKIKVILEDAGPNWGAYAPSVPGVAGTGATPEAARQSLEDGLTIYFDELYAGGVTEIRAEIARAAAQEA